MSLKSILVRIIFSQQWTIECTTKLTNDYWTQESDQRQGKNRSSYLPSSQWKGRDTTTGPSSIYKQLNKPESNEWQPSPYSLRNSTNLTTEKEEEMNHHFTLATQTEREREREEKEGRSKEHNYSLTITATGKRLVRSFVGNDSIIWHTSRRRPTTTERKRNIYISPEKYLTWTKRERERERDVNEREEQREKQGGEAKIEEWKTKHNRNWILPDRERHFFHHRNELDNHHLQQTDRSPSFSSSRERERRTDAFGFEKSDGEICSIFWFVTLGGLIESTERSCWPWKSNCCQISTLVNPTFVIQIRIITIVSDHHRTRIFSPISRTLINVIGLFVDTYRCPVRIQLSTILSIG